MKSHLFVSRLALCLLVFCASAFGIEPPVATGLTIELNYDYDSNGFFENPEAKESLEFAVRAFEPFTDQLQEIEPSGSNQWSAIITHPGSGTTNFPVYSPTISTGTLLVFVGARDLPSTQIGIGGPGGWQSSAPNSFKNVLRYRGQGITSGTTADDFGPWGGAIAFDTHEPDGSPRDWHFDLHSEPSSGQSDFLSTVVHEIAHLLGFGIADSYSNQISGTTFQGPNSVELFGGDGVPNTPDNWHWASGTRSPPYINQPRAALGGSLVLGSRVPFTPLDYAGMSDMGWEVPEVLFDLPGDLDGDLDVDGHDFIHWQQGMGLTQNAPRSMGDADGDGDVDDYDGWILKRNLGARAHPRSLATSIHVPEPATWGAYCFAVYLFCFCLQRTRISWKF